MYVTYEHNCINPIMHLPDLCGCQFLYKANYTQQLNSNWRARVCLPAEDKTLSFYTLSHWQKVDHGLKISQVMLGTLEMAVGPSIMNG